MVVGQDNKHIVTDTFPKAPIPRDVICGRHHMVAEDGYTSSLTQNILLPVQL